MKIKDKIKRNLNTPKNYVESNYYNYPDWVNVKVNNLIIIDFPGYIYRKKGSNTPACTVKCDCGNKFITNFYNVKSGRINSCGCQNKAYKNGDKAACKDLYNRYKYSAKLRDYAFELSYIDFYNIIKEPCHYCNIHAAQVRTCSGCKTVCAYNGIDRVDNTQGYSTTNCTSCCQICNRAKSTMTYIDFISYLNRFRDSRLN